jgi:hypothetical protein
MADVRLLTLGAPYSFSNSNFVSLGAFTLDAATDAITWSVQAKEAATITHVGFHYNSATGTPPTYRISIQGIGATGVADGTIKGGGSPASATFTPPADTSWNSTWQWIALDNAYTCTAGETLAFVIDYSTGTVSAAACSAFVTILTGGSARHGYPCVIHTNAGTPAKQGTGPVIYGYKSASKVFGFPVVGIGEAQFSSNSTPDEYALAFALPGTGTTYQVRGVRFLGAAPAAGKTGRFRLYSGTTALQSYTLDGDLLGNPAQGDRFQEVLFADATLTALTGGAVYRIGYEAMEVSGNLRLRTISAASAADLAALPGGANYYLSTRTDSGAWTDDTAQRPVMELLVEDITEPTAGPGGGTTFFVPVE